jgi:protein-L-isoaspartate(D-aspartate) O-methyltransferase
MGRAGGSFDPRLERAFALVPREMFLGPPPWRLIDVRRHDEETTDDPRRLYRDVLVTLDEEKGINNGEPCLHAAWMAAIAPRSGETVAHIGAGTGYYSAILAVLVLPDGKVHAFEIEPRLAAQARLNLAPFQNVDVVTGDATVLPLLASDIIYVNAGVVAPPVSWLRALDPGGRLVFPWRPSDDVALTLLVTRRRAGLDVEPLMPSWFIPCVGASSRAGAKAKLPGQEEAQRTRSIHILAEEPPDETATAIIGDVWFSSRRIAR